MVFIKEMNSQFIKDGGYIRNFYEFKSVGIHGVACMWMVTI